MSEHDEIQPLLITLEEAARLIAMTPKWIRVNRANLGFVRVLAPRVLRVDPVALKKWIATRRG